MQGTVALTNFGEQQMTANEMSMMCGSDSGSDLPILFLPSRLPDVFSYYSVARDAGMRGGGIYTFTLTAVQR